MTHYDSGSVARMVSFVSHLGTEKMYPKGSAFAHSSVMWHLAPWAFQVGLPTFLCSSDQTSHHSCHLPGFTLLRGRLHCIISSTWRVFTNEPTKGSQTGLCIFCLSLGPVFLQADIVISCHDSYNQLAYVFFFSKKNPTN